MDIRYYTYTYHRRQKFPIKLPIELCDSKVLEVGCGLNNFSDRLLHNEYIGLDLSRQSNVGNHPFVQGDISHLPFEENAFEWVLANNVIEHVMNPLKAIKEMHRVASVGLLIIVPVLDDFPFIYDPVNWIRCKLKKRVINYGIGGFGHKNIYYEKDWLNLFRSNDMVVTDIYKSHSLDLISTLEFAVISAIISWHNYQEVIEHTKSSKISVPVYFKFIWNLFDKINVDLRRYICRSFIINK